MRVTVTATFTVDPLADDHMQSKNGIYDEVLSWLEDLGVSDIDVTIEPEEDDE